MNRSYLPSITTSSLLLRALSPADTPYVLSYAADSRVTQFTPWESATTFHEAKKQITQKKQSSWAILDKTSHRLLGECGYIHQNHESSEIYCTIGYDYWGYGIGSQALQSLIELGFEHYSFTYLQSSIVAPNTRSLRLAHKLGMQHVTTLSKAWSLHNQLHDILVYTIKR